MRNNLFFSLVFIIHSSVFSQNTYFVNANYVQDSFHVIKIIDTTINYCNHDTIHTDSTMKCTTDTCYWTYNVKIDSTCNSSTYATKYFWKVQINFTYFDSHNDFSIMQTPQVYTDDRIEYSCSIDSINGDLIFYPGNHKLNIYYNGTFLPQTICKLTAIDTITKDTL